MKRLSRQAAVSLLFAAACGGRAELETSPYESLGSAGASASNGRAGAPTVGKGGGSSRGGAGPSYPSGGTFSTGGTFSGGTFSASGTFDTGGSVPISGTFGVAGSFPIAGSFGVAGSATAQAGEAGVAGAGGAAPVLAQAVVQVAAGLFHVCILGALGDVKCWGAGDHGALGYGTTESLGDNERLPHVAAVDIEDDASEVVEQIVAGGYHTCVLLTNGTVKCWGENSDGQLGYGDVQEGRGSTSVPASFGTVQVSASDAVTVQSLCAGEKHTCALLSDGSVKCWGSNALGQLGYGNAARVGAALTPAEVAPVSLASQRKVSQIACGANHTCAVTLDGMVQCWGDNQTGQLGLGNLANVGDDEKPDSVAPISIDADASVTAQQVVAGNSHTCIWASNETVRCWGVASALGIQASQDIGDTELPASVGPVRLTESTDNVRPVALSAGSFHTCALFNTGELKCWGRNDFGELGQGDLASIGIDNDPADVAMVAVDVPGVTKVSAFAAGNYLTCAAAVDPESFYCWGWNEYGQLGRGDTFTLGDDEPPTSEGPLELF